MKIKAIMKYFKDFHNRQIRLSSERQDHIEVDHPEMSGQIDKIQDTLLVLMLSSNQEQTQMLSYFISIIKPHQLLRSIYVL